MSRLFGDASPFDETPSTPIHMPDDPDDLLAWATYYRSRGLVVVPLNAERIPIERWTDYRVARGEPAEYDTAIYDRDWRRWQRQSTWTRAAQGVGVLVEFSRLVCVDLDIPIEDVAAHLTDVTGEWRIDRELDAAWVRTRSGHCHLWYTWPHAAAQPNLSVERAAEIRCPHVEIKGLGQCVPLPPTRSAGSSYTWHAGGLDDLTLPPAWLYAMLGFDPTSAVSSAFIDDARRPLDARTAAWQRTPDAQTWRDWSDHGGVIRMELIRA